MLGPSQSSRKNYTLDIEVFCIPFGKNIFDITLYDGFNGWNIQQHDLQITSCRFIFLNVKFLHWKINVKNLNLKCVW